MTLGFYNTLSGKKEDFKPLVDGRIYMFVCGPTVYDTSHIGHARTYIVFDAIARYLKYKGYSVFYLMNVTDIDDKIINRAMEAGISSDVISKMYLNSFLDDMEKLGVCSVNLYANATDHMPEIIDQIQTLIDNGSAYESSGSVYFQVSSFPGFGKLSRQKLDKLEAGARIVVNEDKRNPEDFALWKTHKDGEPWWESPWGKGRPGWHVEDTAISIRYFGDQYDIHGGGMDLMFPHHDSEIAIAESITHKEPFVRYWLHTGFLNLQGEKMSKSIGNIITIKELLERYRPDVLRFFMLNGHYRSPIDFNTGLMDEAEAAYGRLESTYLSLEAAPSGADGGLLSSLQEAKKRFDGALEDDFNTREAIASLFDISREINRALASGSLSTEELEAAGQLFNDAGMILGIFTGNSTQGDVTDRLVKILMNEREKARAKKDWETSDRLRDLLKEAGIVLEDGKDGPRWKLADGR